MQGEKNGSYLGELSLHARERIVLGNMILRRTSKLIRWKIKLIVTLSTPTNIKKER